MNYEISKITPNLIFSNSYISPLDELDVLENDLKKREIKGDIIFDLLLCVGFSQNRYISIGFDGESLDILNVKILENISEEIKNESRKFYSENSSLLKSSVLADVHQYIVKNKLI